MAEIDWEKIKDEFLNVLKVESVNFVTGHAEDVAVLGEDVVKAILQEQLIASIPIPEINSAMSDEELLTVEKILARRDQLAQLISKASYENSCRVAQVQADALKLGLKMGQYLLSVGLGILVAL